ncbi:MAG TPA: peroxiredoxin-like family protein [Stellaceae bacterium]|nr:peroxiredoxin-like family protein [Stellaceae bacterium]
MSLKHELDEIREHASADDRIRIACESLVDQLGRADAAGHALKVGDVMPSFLLPNAEGRLLFSDDLLRPGPLVVSFFRGNWCPYCSRTLEALEMALGAIEEVGGHLVALTPDTGSHFAETKRQHDLTYEILSDVDGAIGLQFGVLFRPADRYRALLVAAGIDLEQRHGNGGWFLPIPATFVVDQSGIVRYTFVNVDFTRRAEPNEIVDVLRDLGAGNPPVHVQRLSRSC